MRLTIEGREREAEIVSVPRGAFYVEDGCAFPVFPMFCAICRDETEYEDSCDDVLICPICDFGREYASLGVRRLKDMVTAQDFKIMKKNAFEGGAFDEGEEDTQWEGHLVDIVNAFIHHGTCFCPSSAEYIEKELGIRFDWRRPGFIGGTAETVGEEVPEMRRLLKTKLSDFNFSVRALNCLKSAELETVGDLVSRTRRDLSGISNIGRKTMKEIDDFLIEYKLSYGMDVSKYMNE